MFEKSAGIPSHLPADSAVRTIARIIVAPAIISLIYKLLIYSGNHDNKLVKILVVPDL